MENIIEQQVRKLFEGADERNWQKSASAMSNEVLLDYSSMTGNAATLLKPEQIMAAWAAFLPGFDRTNHLLSNFTIKTNGLTAEVHYNGKADHFLNGEVWTVNGTYDTKRKGKLVIYDSVNVMVYENRYAEVRIGIKTGGKIEQKMLVAYGALYAGIWTRSNHTEPVRVENYTIVFHKSDGSVIVQKNTGNRFNEATIQIMKELQPGERITFTNIQLSGPSSWPQLEAKPVEFTIL